MELNFQHIEISFQIIGSLLLAYSLIKITDEQIDIITRFTYGGNSQLSASMFQQREYGRLGILFLLLGSVGQLILPPVKLSFLTLTIGLAGVFFSLILFKYWLKLDQKKFIAKLLKNRKIFQNSRQKQR